MTNARPPGDALATAVREVERYAAGFGWDGPLFVFALVRTADALRDDPGFASLLAEPERARAAADPFHLTAVEQQGLPQADTLQEILGSLAWPATVAGAAVVVERVVLTDDDTVAPTTALPGQDRQDVRLAVGVLRDGGSWCAARLRSHDDDASVLAAPDLVPGLVAALRATFD